MVTCASTACNARAAMRMFKRCYYRSNSIRKAIAQFTANLIFLPPQTPVAFLTAMNANRSHPEIQIPPNPPLRKGGRGDFHGTLREASMLSFPVTTQASPWSMRNCAPQAPNFFCQLAFPWIRITSVRKPPVLGSVGRALCPPEICNDPDIFREGINPSPTAASEIQGFPDGNKNGGCPMSGA